MRSRIIIVVLGLALGLGARLGYNFYRLRQDPSAPSPTIPAAISPAATSATAPSAR